MRMWPGTRRGGDRRSFARCERGALSVELVLVTPLLMFLLVGIFGYFKAYSALNANTRIAQTLSEIASRYSEIDAFAVDELFALEGKLAPITMDRPFLRLTSVCFANGAYKVLWSDVRADPFYADAQPLTTEDLSDVELPPIGEQNTLLILETSMRWRPAIKMFGLAETQFNKWIVVQPRFVRSLPHLDLNVVNICPA